MQRYGFFVKPPNVSATFFKKSLFLLHFRVFCRGKLAENALRNSHRCHRSAQMLLLGKNLPQNTRISQNLLLRIFSHRFHSAQMLTSGGALVSSAPTEQYWYTSYFVFVYMICVRCLLRRLSPPLRMGAHPNNLCKSVKSVGGIRTLTICADQWNLWENITARRFCGFCGKKTACLVEGVSKLPI